jgi:hypothetical protein
LPPLELPLGDALEPGPLKAVRLDASLRCGPLGRGPLEDPPRDPNHPAVLPDRDPEFHRLPLSVPARVLKEGGKHWEASDRAGFDDVL